MTQGLLFEHCDFEAGKVMLTGDDLQEVVEIVIGGVPTVLEIHFMCMFRFLGRILLQPSVSTNLFNRVRH